MKSQRTWKTGRLVLLIGLIVIISLASFGCVRGVYAVGWSGGAVQDGTLYIGSRAGALVSIDLSDFSRQTGETLKGQSNGGLFGCSMYGGGCSSSSSAVAIYGTPVFYSDLVYIAGYNGKVYAYRADNLATRWVYPREDYIESIVGGLVVENGRLFFADETGSVYALDAETGDELWILDVDEDTSSDKIWGTPAVADGTLYIGAFNETFYALDAATGDIKWTYEDEDAGGAYMAKPVVLDGVVYVGGIDRQFHAFDADTGTEKWSFSTDNWFWSEATIDGDTICVSNLNGWVYALDKDNGALIWECDLGYSVAASPVVVDDSVVAVNRQGVVYIIDTGSGEMSELADTEIDVNGPVLVIDGVLFIQNDEYQLYRLDISNGAVLPAIELAS